MKALTLWQPWASLIGLGVKTIETRSWPTAYRGPLTIHAAARKPDVVLTEDGYAGELYDAQGSCVARWYQDSEEDYVSAPPEDERWVLAVAPGFIPDTMPLGCIVATCRLQDCVPVLDHHPTPLRRQITNAFGAALYLDEPFCLYEDKTDQLPYGDYRPGRYAWLLADVEALAEPAPTKGHQGLWEWPVLGLHDTAVEINGKNS